MSGAWRSCLALALVGLMSVVGCKKEPAAGEAGAGGGGAAAGGGSKNIVIGMVAKSQSNDVFQAAYAGAKDAAKELGPKYGVNVTIDWRTPVTEDAAKQVEAIEAITRAGDQAVIVSCSDAGTLTPAIDDAVGKGMIVMTFDSDAPNSKRQYTYGADSVSYGQRIVEQLAKTMGDKGTIAILGGNQSAPNLQERIRGAREELAKHPNMKLLEAGGGVFYHEETPEKAAEAVSTVTNANPGIEGWAMVGGWPLFTRDALKWQPGQIKVVSADALPAQLSYVKTGYVDVLLAQDCYGWGYKSVQTLLDKIVKNQEPSNPKMIDPLTLVTKDNVDEYAKNWEKWLGKQQ